MIGTITTTCSLDDGGPLPGDGLGGAGVAMAATGTEATTAMTAPMTMATMARPTPIPVMVWRLRQT